jgi:hypothetical protein
MNENQWSAIPSKLMAKGFSVVYDRISYEPQHPLWCARASRDGRQWQAHGENLGAALIELGRQTQEALQSAN